MVDLQFIIQLVVIILALPYATMAVLLIVFGRGSNLLKDYGYQPTVSIFLPTYNEESFIEKKLNNLLAQTYPIHEILVYDCSSDRTPLIVREYQQKYNMIKLISQETRIGMARTLNQALKDASGSIIVYTGCDSIVNSTNALKELVANFADDSIGGATGICLSSHGVEKYFRKVMRVIQIAETNIDSTIIAHGPSLLAFRKTVVEQIAPNSMADDTEEFVLIRKKGFRTIVDPTVISEEEVPVEFSTRRLQKDRRAQGIVNVLLQNLTVVFNPKYGRFGSVIFPMELFILVISPFLLVCLTAMLLTILYLYQPLLAAALIILIAISALSKSNMIWAIIDTQLSSLIGTIKSFTKKTTPIWVKVR